MPVLADQGHLLQVRPIATPFALSDFQALPVTIPRLLQAITSLF